MGCSCSQATEPEPQKPNTVKKPPPRVNDTIMDLEDTERVLGKLFKNPDKDSSDIDFPRFASHITFYNSLGEEISQPPLEERKHAKILRSLHMLFSLLEPSRHDKIMESAEKEAEGIAFNEKANFSKFIEDVLVKGCPVHLVMKVMTQVHMCPFVGAIVGATFPPYMVKDAGKWTISIQIPTQLTTKEAETINQNEEADISPNQPMSDTNPIQEQAEEDINPSQTPVADHSAPQPSSLSHLDITKPLIVVHHKNQSTLPAGTGYSLDAILSQIGRFSVWSRVPIDQIEVP
ncbi:hypothetical protein BLNAU_8210 [Blattamonas nauphoetae]|uniref:Ras guanine nucleotide exchange factor glfB-like C-terminal domain-containing protein n=1 Tax=Blattamonas nauphoetae TaxID=2049346 RepID=A0ABQ9XZ54_9EUKA|nr:hypothetical protein BLNAU_8210 [Blattamonas nauphoetae]